MNADAPSTDMEDLTSYFDLSPEGFPWRGTCAQDIESRRAQMSDLLIFDILLSSGGLRQPDTLWPVTDVASLRRLLNAIEESTYDALKKDCLVYFLLKWHQDDRAGRFKVERCIPPQFSALSDAYWHLDTGINIEHAVCLLSDVRLNRDYTSKILQAISLSENSTSLIIKYIRTAKPLLTEPDDIDIFQKTFPERSEARGRLLRKILHWCLSRASIFSLHTIWSLMKFSNWLAIHRPDPLTHLVSLPLSPFEQFFVHAYALDPPSDIPSASVPIIQDLVCVRLIQSGNYAEAIKLDRQFATAPHGGRASKAVEERRKMMDEILAVMPIIERSQVEEELEALGQAIGKGKGISCAANVTNTQQNGANGDLSMSWEEIQPSNEQPPSSASRPASASKPFVVGRPATGTPRFGTSSAPRKSLNGALPVQESFTVTGRNLFPPSPTAAQASTSNLPGTQPHVPTIPLSTTANTRSAAASGLKPSIAGGLRFPSTAQPHTTTAEAAALFDTKTPAIFVQNAFYTPDSQSIPNGKRPLPDADTDIETDVPERDKGFRVDDDVEMHSDGASDADLALNVNATTQEEEVNEPPARSDFAQSIFAPESSLGRGRRTLPSFEQLPPGAFMEDELAFAPAPRPTSPSPPPPKTRSTPRARKTPAKQAKRDSALSRSVPGAFSGGPDAENEDDRDQIAPLPERPSRRSRVTRASMSSADGEDEGEVRMVRRSSRLSAASSSPEPVSPQKISAGRARKARVSASSSGIPIPTGKSTRSSRRR
ncbi:hypothetical protein EW146_g4460 [Bondarzewia mesenterica]|uniref:ELYS-like domain-containing protein n=1 Tax=Bondarzewia mesenterica TaxID=1095465 RepID=A0A4S4LUG5_9AGAM|nr:hypothetical protein EW146_g4460 [Bondarzewia mesenterica]